MVHRGASWDPANLLAGKVYVNVIQTKDTAHTEAQRQKKPWPI